MKEEEDELSLTGVNQMFATINFNALWNFEIQYNVTLIVYLIIFTNKLKNSDFYTMNTSIPSYASVSCLV